MESQQVWSKLFEDQMPQPALEPGKFLSLVATYARVMLNYQSLKQMSEEVAAFICNLLALPWSFRSDLPVRAPDHAAAKLKAFQSTVFSPQDRVAALNYLVAIPSASDSGESLAAAILNSELKSPEEANRRVAIECLPIFLYVSGIDNYHYFADSLRDMMSEASVEVIRALAEVSGRLVCVLSGGGLMNWCCKTTEDVHGYRFRLNCSKSVFLLHDCEVLAFLDVLWKLLFCHSDATVRLAATTNLNHVFCHLPSCPALLNFSVSMLEDENYHVRKAFANSVQCYYDVLARTAGNYDELVAFIRKAYSVAEANCDWRLKETIVLTVGRLGQKAEGELLLVIVVILVENLLSPVTLVNVTARFQLKDLALARGLATKELFFKFRRRIASFLVASLLEAQGRGDANPLDILKPLIVVFGFTDRRSFLLAILPHFLPNLVIRRSEESTALVRFLSDDLRVKPAKLLTDNFRFVFCHLICHCSPREVEAGFSYVLEKTKFTMGSLLRYDCQLIYNELLLQMGTRHDQVLRGLSILANADECLGAVAVTSTEDLGEFLRPRFLGFLVFFESQIANVGVPLCEKRDYLQSLVSIMPLMGSRHITAVRMKLMTTLRLVLQFSDPDFLDVCGQAWDVFVRTLNMSTVGPILSQIAIALLPLLRRHPPAVVRILDFLVIENRESLRDHFHELYFIPEIPEMEHIHLALKEFQDKPASQDDLESVIRHSLRGIGHENLEVRIHALRNLRGLLAVHQSTLHAGILGSDAVAPILPRLVDSLLAGCRDGDPQVRNLVGRCLGELGAVDPGRLETTSCLRRDQVKLYRNIDDVNFAVDLICELNRSFLGARDTSTQDCSSYSIQEILLLYECRDSAADLSLPGGQIWSGLPEDTRENIEPLLQSRYVPTTTEKLWNDQKLPIFCNSEDMTYHKWVTTWCGYLTSKVRHAKAKSVFSACIKTISNDDCVALFLLPHILVYVLQDGGEEDLLEVHQEILAVLNPPEDRTPINTDLHHMSMQAVFTALDYLTRWTRLAIIPSVQTVAVIRIRGRPVPADPARNSVSDKVAASLIEFLNRIPRNILAHASFKAHAYTRALMNLEAYVKQHPLVLQDQLSFFQKIYSALDEPDGIAGVICRRKEASLSDQILSHESTGQTQDALSCYEIAITQKPEELCLHKGLLQCLMDLDQPHTALTYASGLIARRSEWISDVNQYRVESAWKLSSWDQLSQFLRSTDQAGSNWGLDLGRIFEAVQSKNGERFKMHLDRLRGDQMAPLSAASMEYGSYQRGYKYIVRLHMLDELEKGITLFHNLQHNGALEFEKMLGEWSNRKQVVQSSTRYLEPILNLRRVLLGIAEKVLPSMAPKIRQEIGRCWLQIAKVSRKCGHLQRAYSSLLAASRFDLPEVWLEQAKWHWQKGEQENGILCLQKAIKEHYSDPIEESALESRDYKLSCAKAKLLLARYTEESGNLESSAIKDMFSEVLRINQQWEEGHFYLAQYYDRLLNTVSQEKYCEMMCRVIKHFGHSLLYGCHFVYQSMPRMLSLWLEFGSSVVDIRSSKKASMVALRDTADRQLLQIHEKLILTSAKSLPPYLFLTAFSQLISRICHSHSDVFSALKTIIVTVLKAYPQQAVWMMIAVSKSTYQMRVKRCQEIFAKAKQESPELEKFLADATKLSDRLVELCNKPPEGNSTTMKMSVHFKELLHLLKDPNFSRIILPRQISMLVTLPIGRGSLASHDPFPQGQVNISGIEDNIEILMSLQKPRKITLRGSDGNLYAMMCKPKDDLRKDCRLMEFNSVVNKFLLRDAESRKRQLHIRTYTVIPLNDECGLLEWVPNLNGLRNILNNIYKEKRIFTTGKELQQMAAPRTALPEYKLNVFKNNLVPKHPPVFSEWFLKTFPDPTAWHFARLSYARTTAVMSMVGYILGLGDRHGENILFDASCGDTVHVDFNCLFNKGESFDWPELVPFRLTHNMVEAMGPLGHDGVYRKTCEAVLRVMRKEIDTLMSLLKPFVYDPLVEWSSRPGKGTRGSTAEPGEIINEKAMTHVQDIEQRLKGIIKSKVIRGKPQGFPLSIEGQVNHLIQEATDVKNLCQMYIGWAAYM